ncbi:MAG: nucleotidyltransferase domain-containing protein [Clostridia bacterium]|nr:nucleotidyltransferase domain-containing protein [Clostridia bacterium]
MKIEESFSNFYNEIHLEDTSTFDSAIKSITKKLNEKYYSADDIDFETANSVIVGSIGRGTAIKNTSDVDMLFILPWSVYYRFDAYTSNGQSALLQEIKSEISERYPRTDIKGDGQAVVIEFEKFSIDLVPAFKNIDDSFEYPDSNNGGSWKNTNPVPEQNKSSSINISTNNNFVSLANILRCWKDNVGFIFGGLLIDSLVCEFLNLNAKYWNSGFDEYVDIIKELLKFLSEKNENSIIYALGSGQIVEDKGKGKYIKKAKDYYDKINDSKTSIDVEYIFIEMFGNRFKKNIVDSVSNYLFKCLTKQYNYVDTEEFIEDIFPINIKYNLNLNCNVTTKGWRVKQLRDIKIIPFKRNLEFYIESTNAPKPYKIYWKVRNMGDEAYKRNQIRGQIIKGEKTKKEKSSFNGPHYVECYLIKNEVCVARDIITVNIQAGAIDGLEVV